MGSTRRCPARRLPNRSSCEGNRMSGRHQGDTNELGEFTFAERVKSIRATIDNLQSAIENLVEHSPRKQDAIDECLAQVNRLQERLRARYIPIGTKLPSEETAPAHPPLHAAESLERL